MFCATNDASELVSKSSLASLVVYFKSFEKEREGNQTTKTRNKLLISFANLSL
jgi:hypothetical protein